MVRVTKELDLITIKGNIFEYSTLRDGVVTYYGIRGEINGYEVFIEEKEFEIEGVEFKKNSFVVEGETKKEVDLKIQLIKERVEKILKERGF